MNIKTELERLELSQRSQKALERAKKQEAKKMQAGYRYITINNRTKVLVECDADGNPTEKGLGQIEVIKRALV